MYSIPSYYEMGSCANSVSFLQGVVLSSSSAATTNMGNDSSIVSSKSNSTAEEKAAAASKSHSEAERRRRKRINGHLSTLRSLVPNTIKTDKASLLAEVVRRLKELKKTTAELAYSSHDSDSSSTESGQSNIFPTETDELKLCYSDVNSATIKVTLCCDDRPELISELTRAVVAAEGKVVRAEMATVGGRTKSVLWVQFGGGGGDGLVRLRRGLKGVVDRAALLSGPGQGLSENKRARLSHY